MKKVVAAMGIMIFLFGAAAGVFAGEDVVKIGYLRIIMSLPTFVAQEKGFFAEQGLKVEVIPFESGTAIMDALLAGRIDVIGSNAITGYWFAAQAAPDRFKIFLAYGTTSAKDDNSFAVVVKQDSPLKNLKDLTGKKVGTFPGATSVALAKAVIRTQIDPEKVIFTEIPPPNLLPALAAGQIDAYFSPEPFGMIAVSKDVGRYLIKSPLTLLKLKRGIPGAGFAFSARFLQERPEQAKKVKAALDKAVDYIRGHEQEARPYLARPEYTGLPEPLAMTIPFDEFIKLEELDKKAGQEYFDVLYKEGAYKEKVDTTKLYYEN
jgi:NitT/TauT family transport system substrate-binding protein